ncbi:hypothetical protein PIB30_062099 [Stylosanthes scabra]|uniref:DUF4283 domain-containing protein n=1 Tax=Stylosanthes scabra TaxID=79078 RepID=A0ABU6RLX1_9FABA|nr:hypothetical protein [Stylosanthes scabra]
MRRNANGVFGFVRFYSFKGAENAVRGINITLWNECKLLAMFSRERNVGVDNWAKQRSREDAVKERRTIQKWIPKKPRYELKQSKTETEEKLAGICVKPIEFRKVMYKLLELWGGPGEIEVRDVGPFRCLITFETVEIRDAALQDELLLSIFDEVRHHWEIFWSLSRRVWIEITGLPIGLWCEENFNNIVKLWGKIVRIDDKTEESKSYSTARMMLDCFQ